MRSFPVLLRCCNPFKPIQHLSPNRCLDRLPHRQLFDRRPSIEEVQLSASNSRNYSYLFPWIDPRPVAAAGVKETTGVEILIVGGGQIWADRTGGIQTIEATACRLD